MDGIDQNGSATSNIRTTLHRLRWAARSKHHHDSDAAKPDGSASLNAEPE